MHDALVMAGSTLEWLETQENDRAHIASTVCSPVVTGIDQTREQRGYRQMNWKIELGRIYAGMTLMQRIEWFAMEAQHLDQLTELGKHGIPTMARSAFDDVMDYQNYERAIAKASGNWSLQILLDGKAERIGAGDAYSTGGSMSYTKGPWSCCETTLAGQCIGFHITGPEYGSTRAVAECYPTDPSASDPGELRANGRLLAAATDLLEALKSIAEYVESEIDGRYHDVNLHYPCTASSALDQARAAIKKATEGTK